MFGLLFGGLLLPMYGNNINHREKINELFDISSRVLFMLSIAIAFSLFFYSEEIIALFYNDSYNGAISVMKILSISIIPIIYTHAFGSLIMVHKEMKKYNMILIIASISTIIFNLMLIPYYKSEGASITSVVTQFIILAGMMYVVSKNKITYISNKVILKGIFFFIIALSIFLLIKNIESIHWLVKLSLSLISTMISSFMLKFLDFNRDIRSVT
jgi:O-antigen/teichoic acid export membrane protein